VRRAHEAPREYASRFREALVAVMGEVDWLIDTAYGLRFGAVKGNADLRQRITATLRTLHEALHSQK